jgi:hypothetical protein
LAYSIPRPTIPPRLLATASGRCNGRRVDADLVVVHVDVEHIVERPIDGDSDADQATGTDCNRKQVALWQLYGRQTVDLCTGQARLGYETSL